MTNRIAISLTTDFPAKNIKAAIVNRGYAYNKCFAGQVLQFIQPTNPAAPIVDPPTEYETSPIIYIV